MIYEQNREGVYVVKVAGALEDAKITFILSSILTINW